MAEPVIIILWPVIPRLTAGVDLGGQLLLPSSDRRKVTELWRARADRRQLSDCQDEEASMRISDEGLRKRVARRNSAARTIFAGFSIEEIDEHVWRISGPGGRFLYWPATGTWRYEDGRPGGGGTGRLRALLAGQDGDKEPEKPPQAASDEG